MSRVNVFITVDTEHSIGGAFADPKLKPVGNAKRIYGRIGDKEYGIALLMDIADNHGLKLTFFVEVFNRYYFGPEETRQVVEYIRKRGHDVQLHIHPNYLNFTTDSPQDLAYSDLLCDYSQQQQVEMLGQAREWLSEYGVENPVAFRAGCYGANLWSLQALAVNGFLMDSSFNRAFLGRTCMLPDWGINDLSLQEGVFEFPITNFQEQSGLRSSRTMPLDINGVSFQEMRHVLQQALNSQGPNNVTVILHSFSFVRSRDVQYNQMRPRRHVIRRFERLCAFLTENKRDFQTMTFGELERVRLEQMADTASHCLPQVPAYLSLKRFAGQLWDRVA